MIPIKEDRELVSSGAEESIKFGISAKDQTHIMSILRDQLYSDKIAAVLREIGANAQDANAEAGRRDVPIEVTLPTLGDPTLRIRDHGPGLSLDDVRTVFSQYGASTKRDSNEAVGMLGIGSKSPFAYSDSFVVTSWHAGSRAIYNAVIDPSGGGQIDLLDVSDCDPSETGVEVRLGVRPADCKAFEDRARQLYVHFEPRPKINIDLPAPPKTRPVTNGLIDDSEDSYGYNGGKWVAVMGCIPYAISLDQLESGTGGSSLGRAARRVSGTLRFGIGELQVAASREALKYGDSTRALLIERLNAAIAEYVRTMLEGIDSLSNWEKRLRVTAVSRRQLPIPPSLKPLSEIQVELKLNAPTVPAWKSMKSSDVLDLTGRSFGIQKRNYNGRLESTSHISVGRESRLVVWDERRSMAGYELGSGDYIVKPTAGNEDRKILMLKELDEVQKELAIDGIEVVKLSSIAWTRPANARPIIPRDRERARSRTFVLNMAMASSPIEPGRPMSQMWTPSNGSASDSDVFVVFEGYNVRGSDSFYETVRMDCRLLKSIGMVHPGVIGYKSTKANPVHERACKGTEYHRWRTTGLCQLLASHPDVARIISAMSFTEASFTAGDGKAWIASGLGIDHPITMLATDERRHMMEMQSASHEIRCAASFVRGLHSAAGQALSAVGDARRLAITDRYPLLTAVPPGALSGGNRKLWVDYVRLVDSLEAKQPQEQEKTEI